MATYCTEGIILKHQDFRESDRLLTIYSKEYGKIKAVARGSRKVTSKLAGNLEPFIHANFMIARGRNFDTIAQVEVINIFKKLKSELAGIQLVSSFSDIVDRCTKEHQGEIRIFRLLQDILTYVDANAARVEKIRLIRWYFIWRLISCLGFQPELHHCLICQKKITAEINYFDFKKGGLVDHDCQGLIKEGVTVTVSVVKILRYIFDKPLNEAVRVRLTSALAGELNRLTLAFLNYTFEQDFKV